MVYRTEKYQKLKAEVEKQSKKCKFLNDDYFKVKINSLYY